MTGILDARTLQASHRYDASGRLPSVGISLDSPAA
jgi:hypothetical protein